MKIIPGFRIRNYIARLSTFLVIGALIAGMAGCVDGGGGGDDYYDLTITSTIGGSVTTPGEGTRLYAANATAELVAEPDDYHHFVNWTGDVDTIGNVTVAATNITMYDSYSITANFELDEGWYSLTILNNYGGSVIEPGEGYFAYASNTTVDLVAEPDKGYRFVKWTGDVETVADVNDASTNITMDDNYSIRANFEWFDIAQVDAGWLFTVGLKSDHTVVAVGDNYNGQCNVGNWTDIIQVATGDAHTVGLKSDHTVVAVGHNWWGQCDVGNWTDIIQVAAGGGHTVGLKSDHTVVAVGDNWYGQCDVGSWTDVIQVAAGNYHTVGLKSNGIVVAVGYNYYGQCNVGSWTDIVQVAAGGWGHTLGLKKNGTMVAVGDNSYGQCNVAGWTDIIQVAADVHTVGLKSDHTVVAVGVGGDPEKGTNEDCGQCDVGAWTDITQVAAGRWHTVGIKSDGTVVAVGDNICGQCNVGG